MVIDQKLMTVIAPLAMNINRITCGHCVTRWLAITAMRLKITEKMSRSTSCGANSSTIHEVSVRQPDDRRIGDDASIGDDGSSKEVLGRGFVWVRASDSMKGT